jgi:UDP-GlcNAc:undecaprenyl-phosphate/decaprenyl-phosphate GlcNAc-1-phosphate transferase
MNGDLKILATPLLAFVVAAVSFVPVRRLALRFGAVAYPGPDSRHSAATPYFGGLSIIGATLAALAVEGNLPWWLALGALAMLAVGAVDDAIELSPRQKFGANLVVALVLVAMVPGFGLAPWPLVDAALAIFWLLSTTNAFNLIDGLDGLAAGIGIIAAVAIAATALLHHDTALAGLSLALAGALAGFLMFNFHPASIFMGDGGALPAGLLLGVLSLRAAGLAGNSRLTIYVFPMLVMLVPLLDTAIVSVTRLATGRGISRRGRDHSHDRLLALGLSDERAVVLCWAVAACGAFCAVEGAMLPHRYLVTILPLMALLVAAAGLFMMDLTFDSEPPGIASGYLPRLAQLVLHVSYKWRLVDVALDGILITAAYFGAFLIRLDFRIDDRTATALIHGLPWVMFASYPAFSVTGVYRVIWRYAGLSSVLRFGAAAVLATVLLAALSALRPVAVSGSVLILFAMLTFNLLVLSRLSFRILRAGIRHLVLNDRRVLIVGAGSLGEAAARSLADDRLPAQRLVGFVDDDGFKRGKLLDGRPVLGSLDDLPQIHAATGFTRILIADDSLAEERLSLVWSLAHDQSNEGPGIEIRVFSMETTDPESDERNERLLRLAARPELRRTKSLTDADRRPTAPRASRG